MSSEYRSHFWEWASNPLVSNAIHHATVQPLHHCFEGVVLLKSRNLSDAFREGGGVQIWKLEILLHYCLGFSGKIWRREPGKSAERWRAAPMMVMARPVQSSSPHTSAVQECASAVSSCNTPFLTRHAYLRQCCATFVCNRCTSFDGMLFKIFGILGTSANLTRTAPGRKERWPGHWVFCLPLAVWTSLRGLAQVQPHPAQYRPLTLASAACLACAHVL